MEKHTLYFQTAKEAKEAELRLGPFVGIWECLESHEGQQVLVVRTTDPLDATNCTILEAAAKPCKSIWNVDAWADTPYRHTFYYYDLIEAESAQEILHWSFSAWSKVVPVASCLYKICFGTEKELTEQEQRDWCWTYDPNEFAFNERRPS